MDVQLQVGLGTVAFTIVGIPDKAVRESRERVQSALFASVLSRPHRRITVNLVPVAGVAPTAFAANALGKA